MARPKRPNGEAALVAKAAQEIGVTGSRRKIALEVTLRVADLAVAQLTLDELDEVLARAQAEFRTPALAALAFDNDGAAARLVAEAAVSAFERRNYRHAARTEWDGINASVRNAVSGRLAERYRRT